MSLFPSGWMDWSWCSQRSQDAESILDFTEIE